MKVKSRSKERLFFLKEIFLITFTFHKPDVMKKIMLMAFTALMLCSKQNVNAQITLEHTYDSAGYNLSMVNLEIEGYKYLFKDIWWQRRLVLYNLDHSIFKIIYYPFTTGYAGGAHLYISEHLFNTDDKIEYLFA